MSKLKLYIEGIVIADGHQVNFQCNTRCAGEHNEQLLLLKTVQAIATALKEAKDGKKEN